MTLQVGFLVILKKWRLLGDLASRQKADFFEKSVKSYTRLLPVGCVGCADEAGKAVWEAGVAEWEAGATVEELCGGACGVCGGPNQ